VSDGVIAVATDGPARAIFTTRPAGDVREAAARAALLAAAGADPARVAANRQVHGARVREVTAPDPDPRPEADGLVTSLAGVPLLVVGADCLPVLLWRADRPRVAAAHAGRRGLVAGVLERAVAALGAPAATRAAIGPGIGPCHYPVSADVRTRFGERFGAEVVRGEAVDLAAAARVALRAAGLADAAITTVPGCTACEPARFWSYRRDGAAAGRQGGLVWAEAA
jgi:YfiH family protein